MGRRAAVRREYPALSVRNFAQHLYSVFILTVGMIDPSLGHPLVFFDSVNCNGWFLVSNQGRMQHFHSEQILARGRQVAEPGGSYRARPESDGTVSVVGNSKHWECHGFLPVMQLQGIAGGEHD